MSPTHRLRACVCLWVAASLAAAFQLFKSEVPDYPGYYAPIVESTELRMFQLRGKLLGAGVVAYASDTLPVAPDTKGEAAYYLTQYALAPTIVDRKGEHELAVGNVLSSAKTAMVLRKGNWEVIQDLGDGVLLLRRRGP